ncbi:metallothionein-1 [Drosophila eugracilis]|nr:metallothionein-1 [Drosophila eugracilis]
MPCPCGSGCKCSSQAGSKGSCNCGSDCKCGGDKKSACGCSK